MDASAITRTDTLITPASSQRPKNLESNEPAIETRPDNDQDNSLKVANEPVKSTDETVTLSDTSLKLSTSSPVKSSDRATSVENRDQAQQALSQLLTDFKSNPTQALGAQSNVFAGAVKSLLG